MTKQIEIGSVVEVNEFDQRGRNIGRGTVEDIVTLKGYAGPVACIRISGTPGRFLREVSILQGEVA